MNLNSPIFWAAGSTLRVNAVHVHQMCVMKCPPGYRPLGDPVSGCEFWYPDDPSHDQHTWSHHAVSSQRWLETKTYESTRLEWRWSTTGPWAQTIIVIRKADVAVASPRLE
jgi:hypothetical protein